MANRAREESDVDPLEDELEFAKAMKKAGFASNSNWFQTLAVPAEEPFSCKENVEAVGGDSPEHFGFLFIQVSTPEPVGFLGPRPPFLLVQQR